MRPVNLVPPEERRGENAPLRAGVASYAIVAVLALALAGVVLVVLTNNRIADSEAEIATLETRKAQADAQAAELAPYGEFASLEQARSETVSSLAQSRFDWERVLSELALVIPHKVTLENITASVSAGAAGTGAQTTTGGSAPPAGPSLLISGCAKGQKGTARMLASLRDIDGVTRVGMQSSELGDEAQDVAGSTATAEGGTTDCQTRPSVAKFQITVAFDQVELPVAPAAAGTTPAAGTTTPPADDGGVAETATEQAGAVDSAETQTSDSSNIANAVGVGN